MVDRGGIASHEALALVRARNRQAAITSLDDPALWGGPIGDERYLLVSPPPTSYLIHAPLGRSRVGAMSTK
jgi:hypothetical protein